MTNADDTLTLALDLAKHGYFVFPTDTNKKPLCKWQSKSTSHPGVVDEYFYNQPGRLIGVDCQKSRVFVVDLDVKNGVNGLATWDGWMTGQPPLPECPTQSTPSGGRHLVFSWPDGLDIPNAVGFGHGVDLRSRGYFCTGTGYTWLTPYTVKPPAPPAWLVDKIKAAKTPPEAPRKPQDARISQKPDKSTPDPQKWLTEALQRAVPGNRNETGFWLACQLRDNHVPEAEALASDYPDRVPAGQHPYTRQEWIETVRSAYNGTPRQPAKKQNLYQIDTIPTSVQSGQKSITPPEPEAPPDWQNVTNWYQIDTQVPAEDTPAAIEQIPKIGTCGQADTGKVTTWADMVDIIGPVAWDWKYWLAKGFLAILAAASGEGKSAVTLRICGSYLSGWSWPDGTPYTDPTGAVVWCEAESAQALNLSRARAWGLPIDRIYTPLSDPMDDINLDLDGHRAALYQKAILPEVRLLVVDSMRGMHNGDENSSATMTTVKWLATLARDTGKPVILTHHLRKRSLFDGEDVDLDRLRGSSGIVQPARLVWALDTPDPNQKTTKRLRVIKSNLAKFPDPVGVTIGETVTFGTPPQKPIVETQVDRAADLLLSLLRRGPVPATQIESEFDQAGISPATMKRAKAKLGVVSGKNINGWFWALPAKGEDTPLT